MKIDLTRINFVGVNFVRIDIVADAGFLEEGFCYIIVCEVHVKFLKPCPLSI